mgnify:CR=1 FL=1
MNSQGKISTVGKYYRNDLVVGTVCLDLNIHYGLDFKYINVLSTKIFLYIKIISLTHRGQKYLVPHRTKWSSEDHRFLTLIIGLKSDLRLKVI